MSNSACNSLLRFVLVQPSHPGNIGAAARAIYTMGLDTLHVVSPKSGSFPSDIATARAAGAATVLQQATLHDELRPAIDDCHLVIACSARSRTLSLPILTPAEAATVVRKEQADHPTHRIAVLFGNEQNGLPNDAFEHCQYQLVIPTQEQYRSLNLAAAVQIVAYALQFGPGADAVKDTRASLQAKQDLTQENDAAEVLPVRAIEELYTHMERTFTDIDFIARGNPRYTMRRIRHLFNRARLDQTEVAMLRGLLSCMDAQAEKAMSKQPNKPIYLDYMATTPVDSRVAKVMQAHLVKDGIFGNPSSSNHIYGWEAAEAVKQATQQVAECLGTQPKSLVWTSGATEAINLALKGAMRFYERRGKHLITFATEHKAVLDTCTALQQQGYDVTVLPVDSGGLVDLAALEATLRDDTVLVSVLHVNNEIGVVQDLHSLGELTRRHGALLHVDGAQSLGKLHLELDDWPVDMMSFSAHKAYGPKGVGVLYMRRQPKLHLAPLIHGGGQQYGLRAGTLATHQMVGMGAACELISKQLDAELEHINALHTQLKQGLLAIPGIRINGHEQQRVPHNLNISVADVDGESLLLALQPYIAVSSGSACTSATMEPSHVLAALGVPRVLAHSSLRLSLGRFSTEQDISAAIAAMTEVVTRLRRMGSPWTGSHS